MALSYIDTSALANWYLPEPGSETFSEWMQSQEDTCISSLTTTEFRGLLARRRHILNASLMIASLPSVPLRTLDALHLTIANDIPVEIIATAEKVMGEAAQLLEFDVVIFGEN